MRMNWRGVLGLALSAGFLYWALHDIDPAEVRTHLEQSNLWLLIASALCTLLIFPLRAIRWRIILEPVVPDVRFGPLWRSVCIGMMVNNIVPARVGELARAYAITREEKRLTFTAAFASLAVDRIFDTVIVMLLIMAALLDPALPAASADVSRRLTQTLGVVSIAAAGVLGVLYLLVFAPRLVISWFERLTRRIAPRFEARGRDVLLAFASGLSVLRSPARFTKVFLWTLAHWLVNALAFWIAFKAVGIEASFFAALLVQGVIVISVALPQAPGFFGVFEAAARWTLVSVYAVGADRAITWAIGFHLLSFIPITLIGGWYFVRMGLHLGDIREETQGPAAPDEVRAPS
jgi:glycosyltransferase 2 family protein